MLPSVIESEAEELTWLLPRMKSGDRVSIYAVVGETPTTICVQMIGDTPTMAWRASHEEVASLSFKIRTLGYPLVVVRL